MNNYYIEVLVKREVENEKKKRQIIAVILAVTTFSLGIITLIPIFWCLFVMNFLGYCFLVRNYHVEFEYFYMDGDLVITKIINKSRRKKVLELNDGAIKLIAPLGSAELQMYRDLKNIDCTANNPLMLPYSIICENKGRVKCVSIQISEELYKALKRNMPNKVINY